MYIILNKVLTGIVVWQMSDVILIHYLLHCCLADEWCYPYTLFTALLFGRWVMLSLYTVYCIVVWQMSDVILIHYLLHCCLADEWCYPYTLFTSSLIHTIGYEGRLYILYTVIFVLSFLAHYIHSHTYVIFQNSPRCTSQYHTWRKNTVCSLFCASLHTHGNDVVSLFRANAENVSLPGDLFEIQMDLVSLEICHLHSHFACGIL